MRQPLLVRFCDGDATGTGPAGAASTTVSVTSRGLRVAPARQTGVPTRSVLERERRLSPAARARARLERGEPVPPDDELLSHRAKRSFGL